MSGAEPVPNGPSGKQRVIVRYATDFPFSSSDRARLQATLGDGVMLWARSHDELVEIARAHPEIDVLSPVFHMADLPPLLPHLSWLALPSAGANHVADEPWASGPDAPVITTASGVHAAPISEHVFSAILLWSRRWPDLMRLQAERGWTTTYAEQAMYAGRELEGATLLVIGFGSIGRRIARLGRAFGMRALAVRRSAPATRVDPDADVVASIDELDRLLPQADYVVIATPSTSETRGLISAARLALMKPEAMLVNIARGGLVDEPALIAALTSGALAAAALDVTSREPLPPEDPLWSAPNLFISPHISGLTPHYSQRFTDIMLENIVRYRAGQPLRNLVDVARGY